MIYFEFVKIVLSLLIIAGGSYSFASLLCVLEFFRPRKNGLRSPTFEPVSIIKPLKGSDAELRENLQSFCRQDYPVYEVLFGVTESDDDAVTLVKEVAAAHPDCDIRMVISHNDTSANPKVSNLMGLIRETKYPMIAISDSDMRVAPSYLKEIVTEYLSEDNVGLVTSLYKITNPASIFSALESLTIAIDFIPSVLVARKLEGMTFGLGASLLMSKKALEDVGGFSRIADYLADDYQIGNNLWKKNYKIVLSSYVIEDVVGAMGMVEFLSHQLRWARTYRVCRPKGFLGYGITHIFPFALFFLMLEGPTIFSLSLVGCVLALRFSMAFVIYRKVIIMKKWLRWLALVPIKDLLSFGIWFWSFFGKTVFWRGKYYEIMRGGVIKQKPL